MAASKRLSSQTENKMAQAPIMDTCELCDKEKIEWKCIECNQLICSSCKKIHKRTAATQKHEVIDLKNVVSAFPYKITCHTHISDQYQLYCKDCAVLVCNKCITSTHERHKFCDVENIVAEKKKQLKKSVENLREILKTANEEANKFHREQKKALKTYEFAINSIDEYVEKIIKEIDNCKREMIKSIETAMTEASREIKTRENKHELRKTHICNVIHETEETLKSSDNIRIVQCQSFIDKSMAVMPHEVENMEPSVPKFIPLHETFPIKSEFLIGKLEYESKKLSKPPLKKSDSTISQMSIDSEVGPISVTTIKHSFQVSSLSDRSVGCIAVVNDNEAYVACPYDQNISLVRRNGNLVKEIPTEFSVSGIAVNTSGDLLVSSAESHSLFLISATGGEAQVFMETFPSEPHGISVTKSGEILICLTDGDYGRVARLSDNGKTKHEYDTYIIKNQSFLFRKPTRCVESVNEDIWILDEAAKKIVVLDKKGMFRFLWDGNAIDSGSRSRIEPSGLDCDDDGNILVTDYDNDVIYIIDQNNTQTELLKVIEKKRPLKDPYGIAVHANKFVWVGCEDGIVHVMRYSRKGK